MSPRVLTPALLLVAACGEGLGAPLHEPLWGAWTSAAPARTEGSEVTVDLQVDARQTPTTAYTWRTTAVSRSPHTAGCVTRLWFQGRLTAACEPASTDELPTDLADATGCIDLTVDGGLVEVTGCDDPADDQPRAPLPVAQHAADFEALGYAFVGDRLWLAWEPVIALRPCADDELGCGPGELPAF